jgi:hypothetical protein
MSKIISAIAYLLHNYFDPDKDKELNPEFQQSLLEIRQKRQLNRIHLS